MKNVLIVEAKPSKVNFEEHFSFGFDLIRMSDNPKIKKLLKKDVNPEILEKAKEYEWVILVGADPLKYFTKKTSITEYSGKVINEKFIGAINPAMLLFKPEAKSLWEQTVKATEAYISGRAQAPSYNSENFIGIEDPKEAAKYIQNLINLDDDVFAVDTETGALYPRKGELLGVSLSGEADKGAYISADCFDEDLVELLQELVYKKTPILHHAKFDLAFLKYHLHLDVPFYHDTMLIHYCLDEKPGTHGLKQLALKYTRYGDYEEELEKFKNEFAKQRGILKRDFSYTYIPFDVMYPYAAIDAAVTFLLFKKLYPAIQKNSKLLSLYKDILLPASTFLHKTQENGVPFCEERLGLVQESMSKSISDAEKVLMSYPEVQKFIEDTGGFNPNSVSQLRKLLFDYLKLSPTGIMTDAGQHSTNAEVLEILSESHEIPKQILTIRQKSKIKNTYIDKVIPELDKDKRLRTNFNLHSTTSGRLSSSGVLNMQQIPRDDPSVKGCIKARPGHKIISADLQTAEMYVAAVLSGDKALMDVFISGGNFHSTVAHKVFKLKCKVEEVAEMYPGLRQAAKAVSFGILYGATAKKISETVTKETGTYFSISEAEEVIEDYFSTFYSLKKWIDNSKDFIQKNSYIYSYFNRKRRLLNVKSSDRGVASHEIRSGINFLIQSTASDINLLGAIEMQKYIEEQSLGTKIFALVHDSILAEVPDDEVEHYTQKVVGFIQKDRGLSIPGSPIKVDVEIGEDYSFGKFDKMYYSETAQ